MHQVEMPEWFVNLMVPFYFRERTRRQIARLFQNKPIYRTLENFNLDDYRCIKCNKLPLSMAIIPQNDIKKLKSAVMYIMMDEGERFHLPWTCGHCKGI